MNKKKIVVFGGGLSGLTAAYLLLEKGYDVTIIDKNSTLGGYCSTYIKNDAYIDTCIQYLVGSKNSELIPLYKKLGFFDNAELINYPHFYKFHYFDKSIEISRDFSKFKQDLISLSLKEDKPQLNEFFKDIKSFYHFPYKTSKAMERMNIIDYIKLFLKNFIGLKAYFKYKKISIDSYASKFNTPIINEFIRSMMPNNVSIAPYLGLIASFFKGNADSINISSKQVIDNLTDKIVSLGGNIILNEEITSFNIVDDKLVSILSKDKEYKADYFVSGLPLTYLYSNLLDKDYQDKEIESTLFDYTNNPPISAFLVYYKIKASSNTQISDYFIKYIKDGFKCISSINRSIGFKYYSHILNEDNSHTIVGIIDQNIDDFTSWKNMSKEEYETNKNEIARRVKKELLSICPTLENKIDLVEILTPLSLYKYTYNFGGSYMANLMSESSNRNGYKYTSNKIKNLVFSSIWMTNLGGIPSALTSGEFASNEIIKRIKKD